MFQYTIANRIIPNLSISVEQTTGDVPSLSQIVLKLKPAATANENACTAFKNYLESFYDVAHTTGEDGSWEFVLKPTGSSWHSSPVEHLRSFTQHISAYYGIPIQHLYDRCENKAFHNTPYFSNARLHLKNKLAIVDRPDLGCIQITLQPCEPRDDFCAWLEGLYESTRTTDADGVVTLHLRQLKGTEDRLKMQEHVVLLARAIIDSWGFRRSEVTSVIQSPELKVFCNTVLNMRPHPLLEQEMRNKIYGSQPIVIGAGFSGVSVAIKTLKNLISNPPALPMHMTVIERSLQQFAAGIAYGLAGPEHHMNVQGQYISIDESNPNDFVEWVAQARHDHHQGDARFRDIPNELIIPSTDPKHAVIQRLLYRHYLLDRLYETVNEARARGVADFEVIFSEALAADVTKNQVFIHLKNGEMVKGTHLVDATGHGPAAALPFLATAAEVAPDRVVIDQWNQRAQIERLTQDLAIKSITVLGTALSAEDVVMTAERLGFFDDPSRELIMLSRGAHLHPRLSEDTDYIEPAIKFSDYEARIPHAIADVPDFVQNVFTDVAQSGMAQIGRPYRNEEVFFALYRHIPAFIRAAKIPLAELFALLKKNNSLINTIAVPKYSGLVDTYRPTGQIKVLSGDTTSITKQGDTLMLKTEAGIIMTNAVVSALPPQSDPKRMPFVRDMLDKGVVRMDPETGIGLDVTDNFAAIDAEGKVRDNVLLCGPVIAGHVIEKLGMIGPLAQVIWGLRPETAAIATQLSDSCTAGERRRVGLVMNLQGRSSRFLSQRWVDALYEFGFQPYLIDPSKVSMQHLDRILDNLDCVFLPGGDTNVYPKEYGQEPLAGLKQDFDREGDNLAIAIIQKCRDMYMPVLGECLGCQRINVAYGGTIDQMIGEGHDFGYIYPERRAEIAHDIIIEPGGRFAYLYGAGTTFGVTSVHRQGIRRENLAGCLHIEATALPIGNDPRKHVIEGFSDPEHPFMVGIHYHGEFNPLDRENRILFSAFREAADIYHDIKARAPETVPVAEGVEVVIAATATLG